jgi:hypothetical protein
MPRLTALILPLALAVSACDLFNDDDDRGGAVTIVIQQQLTGETTSAGTFTLSGRLSDAGATTESLVFGGPLDQPVVPVTFTRVLTGQQGTITITGSATITFSSPTVGALAGEWSVQSGTGKYANLTGAGTLAGSADFGLLPPAATLQYAGELRLE